MSCSKWHLFCSCPNILKKENSAGDWYAMAVFVFVVESPEQAADMNVEKARPF